MPEPTRIQEFPTHDQPPAGGTDSPSGPSTAAPVGSGTLLQPPDADPIPTSLPSHRFALGQEIARGGMGVVHMARDTHLGRDVAVKMLTAGLIGTAAGRRFFEEARITGQLQHPGIPPVHDLGTLPDGRPFLAMKLIKGQTLDALLKEHGPGGRWLPVFEKVCEAVGYAHAHGVIHRDLKPLNVMVGAFGEVQVMDWGLAKLLAGGPRDGTADDPDATAEVVTAIRSDRDGSDATRAGSVMGTPAYMAPEQAIGAVDQLDRRTDVFGLGAVLCHLLTGRPPYQSGDAESTRQLAARGKLDDAFGRLDRCAADPEVVALCKRCLGFEPADRPADAGAVASAVARLRAAADERARQAEVEAGQAAVRAAEGRKRMRAYVLLTGLVGVVLATVIWLVRVDRLSEKTRAEVAKQYKEVEDWREKHATREADLEQRRFMLMTALRRVADEMGACADATEVREFRREIQQLTRIVADNYTTFRGSSVSWDGLDDVRGHTGSERDGSQGGLADYDRVLFVRNAFDWLRWSEEPWWGDEDLSQLTNGIEEFIRKRADDQVELLDRLKSWQALRDQGRKPGDIPMPLRTRDEAKSNDDQVALLNAWYQEDTGQAKLELGILRRRAGDVAAAMELIRDGLKACFVKEPISAYASRRGYFNKHYGYVRGKAELAEIAASQGQLEDADRHLADARSIIQPLLDWNPFFSGHRSSIRCFYAAECRVALARRDHKRAAAGVIGLLDFTHSPVLDRVRAAGFLGRCTTLTERAEERADYQRRCEELLSAAVRVGWNPERTPGWEEGLDITNMSPELQTQLRTASARPSRKQLQEEALRIFLR